MAIRSAHVIENVIWQTRLPAGPSGLADAVRDAIAETRAHMLDVIKLDETPPHHALTLAQWQRPAELQSLLATYSDISTATNLLWRARTSRCCHFGRNGISG